MQIIRRALALDLSPGRSAFLWGPRKVGKTYWIHNRFLGGSENVIDLLETDTFADYAARPALLRESHKVKRALLVSLEKEPRDVDGVEILPWRVLVERLWAGDLTD